MRHDNDNNKNPRHTYRVDPKTGRKIRWSKIGLLNPNGRGNFINLKKRAKATRAPNGTVIMWKPTVIGAKGTTNRRVIRETKHGYIHTTKGYKSADGGKSHLIANGWKAKATTGTMFARLFGLNAGAV